MSLTISEKLPYRIHIIHSSYEELINVLKENPEIEMSLERKNFGYVDMSGNLSREDCVLLKLKFSRKQIAIYRH